MSSAEMEKLLSKDSSVLFKDVLRCLDQISVDYKKNMVDVLLIIDSDPSFSGVRKWFNEMGSKYHPFRRGTNVAYPSDDIKKAEELFQSFSILITGARKGDMLIGLKTQSKNSIIQLFQEDVPPDHKSLDSLRSFESLWNAFLDKLNTIPYFSRLSKFEKELYLEYSQKVEDIYLDDVEGLGIKVIDIGEAVDGGFLQLPEETIEYLSAPEKIFSVKEITDLFPRKPGSSGIKGRHTLIFRRGLWKIYFEGVELESFRGIVIDADAGIIKAFSKKRLHRKLFLFQNIPKTYKSLNKKQEVEEVQDICVSTFYSPIKLSEPEKIVICINNTLEKIGIDDTVTLFQWKEIGAYFNDNSFTPAGYKSLLQKIIRFGPREKVIFGLDRKSISPAVLLTITIGFLFLHPGSFVPDIQRYVSGKESAFKRVVVTLLEDSYLSNISLRELASCAVYAFLSQRVKTWEPTSDQLETCFRMALKGYFSMKAFVWDIEKGLELPRIPLDFSCSPIEIISAILDEIKSFSGDLALARYLAYEQDEKEGELAFTTPPGKLPMIMPIEHCIDQHWAPEIVYFYSEKIIKENLSPGNFPFSKLFIRIFSEVTGINPFRPPRRGITMNVGSYDVSFEDREFVKETRKAQTSILFSKNKKEPSIYLPLSEETYPLKYSFSPEWIAGMIGVIEVPATKKGPTALVTLSPSYLRSGKMQCHLVPIRKPFRDMKDPFLSDERAEEAIEYVKSILEKGILIQNNIIPFLKGKMCRWDEKNSNFLFLIGEKGKEELWKPSQDVLDGIKNIPYLTSFSFSPDDINELTRLCFSRESDGIVKNPESSLQKILEGVSISTISKLSSYLSNKSIVEIKKIGREGGGSKEVVVIEDVFAYHLFLKIYLLFPFVFSRKKSSALDFYIKNKEGALFIVEQLRFYMKQNTTTSFTNYGGDIGDRKKRKLWEHQEEAIAQLKENIEKGRKGSFIWLPVGSGKTMIVLEYLTSKIKNKTIPPYVIYTLPSSAMENTIHEIESYGFSYRILIPLKNIGKYSFSEKYIKKDCIPEKGCINLIEQDHLRLCDDMTEYVKDSIFIIDEVHKALNETKRTATALQFSHLSREFIALTGTPIIDSNTYKLVWWLEQIVPFEVDQNNFWVAANDMISRKFSTGVNVIHVNIPMNLSFEDEQKYKKLVPPSLGGTNEHPRSDDFQKAVELCYTIATEGMINVIREMLSQKRGVFVVGKDVKHQEEIYHLLLEKNIAKKEEIFLITSKDSIFLTDETVENGKVPDYKIVITTVRKSAGYTLTRLSAMVTSVYPSNNADREQLEGRLNRIGQKSPDVIINTIHCGILSYILSRHMDAKNLSAVLCALAADIHF